MALEQRFKQMEDFEEECMHLRNRVQELETRENDNKIKLDMAVKDKEELKKKLDLKANELLRSTKKEEDLQAKMDDMQKAIKEKEQIAEKKVEENFSLKEIIDKQRKELDKLKKQFEVT